MHEDFDAYLSTLKENYWVQSILLPRVKINLKKKIKISIFVWISNVSLSNMQCLPVVVNCRTFDCLSHGNYKKTCKPIIPHWTIS